VLLSLLQQRKARFPRLLRCDLLLCGLLLAPASALHAQSMPVADALARALKGTQASAVVLDQSTGAQLASISASAGAPRAALPGSAIKPLLLEYALEKGIMRADAEVYCRRDLHVAGRALPCTHPADRPVFTAERALAESCNTWFAEMGKRFSGEQLEAALRQTGLPHESMIGANVEQRELTVLGLRGVSAAPLQLARAYRELLAHAPSDGVVARGLRGSVSYGMARPASVPGMNLLGKTGTASQPGQEWTHGWFAGAVPGRMVIVVYVPHADGGTAAGLAKKFFASVAAASGAR
jgi:cell division protein FtsI/penicillin-binding protein 2